MTAAVRAIASLALGASLLFQSWGFMLPQQDPTGTLILVNKQNRAPTVPVTLVKPNVTPTDPAYAENIYMRPEAAAALETLFAGARDAGLTLYATSGFRSYATQKAIYERKVERSGERAAAMTVAKPGYSEHQTGLAMDVEGQTTLGEGLVEAFGESPEGIWLAENCWDYGFILRYPKDATEITGYIYEPWHVRYVGEEAALEIRDLGVTLEEYLPLLRGERIRQMEDNLSAGEADDEEENDDEA